MVPFDGEMSGNEWIRSDQTDPASAGTGCAELSIPCVIKTCVCTFQIGFESRSEGACKCVRACAPHTAKGIENIL